MRSRRFASFDEPDQTFVMPDYNDKIPLLDKLEVLMRGVADSQFSEKILDKYSEYINSVSENLGLTKEEVILLCPFIYSPTDNYELDDISRYFDCSSLRIVKYCDVLRSLHKKGYLSKSIRLNCIYYRLSREALMAIGNNRPLVMPNTTDLTAMEFIQIIQAQMRLIEEDKGDLDDIYDFLAELFPKNRHLKIVQNIDNLGLDNEDKLLLLFFCKRAVLNIDYYVTGRNMALMFNESGVQSYKELCNECHRLQKMDIVEIKAYENIMGASEPKFGFTEKGESLMLSEFDLKIRHDKQFRGIINRKSIQQKVLFFNDKNKRELDNLYNLLDEEKLKDIRRRLKEKNMLTGFTCMFYGAPGTGKTESVMQLAKETGRDIMQVDISSTRDKWYGETEKLIKKIFTDYSSFAKQSEKLPILLFNEADAIFSVRKSLTEKDRTVDTTENAIQNILLQELERFEGILIATTNLTGNLDKAFERRFLYKIKFDKPNIKIKQKIWQSQISKLTDLDAENLSKEFDFSGGQINNVIRKSIICEALYGKEPDIEDIRQYCKEESIVNSNKKIEKIGFL